MDGRRLHRKGNRKIMKRNIVVTDINSCDFDQRVNQLTKDGWKIIPESLKISVSSTSDWNYGPRKYHSFGVVLEKETVE